MTLAFLGLLVWLLLGLAVGVPFGMAMQRADQEQAAEVAAAQRRHPSGRLCSCGHTSNAHEHYRHGSDCAVCDCTRFRHGAVAA